MAQFIEIHFKIYMSGEVLASVPGRFFSKDTEGEKIRSVQLEKKRPGTEARSIRGNYHSYTMGPSNCMKVRNIHFSPPAFWFPWHRWVKRCSPWAAAPLHTLGQPSLKWTASGIDCGSIRSSVLDHPPYSWPRGTGSGDYRLLLRCDFGALQ